MTDEQIKKILEWHADFVAWQATRAALPTLRELAAQIGLARSTIWDVIERRGVYKRATPENRVRAIRERSARLARLGIRRIR